MVLQSVTPAWQGVVSGMKKTMAIAAGGVAAAVVLAGFATAQGPEGAASAESLFKGRCASCHEPNIERAPSRATLAQMSPAQIAGALDGGVMAPMAVGLSKADIAMLAAHLGASATASATPALLSPAAPAAAGAG